jgi:hypothetical protein
LKIINWKYKPTAVNLITLLNSFIGKNYFIIYFVMFSPHATMFHAVEKIYEVRLEVELNLGWI